MCVVPPVIRSTMSGPRKKTDSADVRCQACWLKLCLIGYNLDIELYDKLRLRLPKIFMDLLPVGVNRGKSRNLIPHRGEILQFSHRQVPLSRPLFEGFGENTCKSSTEDKKISSKPNHIVHERLPNGWTKKAVKILTGAC